MSQEEIDALGVEEYEDQELESSGSDNESDQDLVLEEFGSE